MDFDIKTWLEGIGLSEYLGLFTDEGFDDTDVLIELTETDFQEIGITKKGHLIKLRKAVEKLSVLSPQPFVDPVDNPGLKTLIDQLPRMVALPLQEYINENHATQKLWAACDVIELLLRFLVTIGAADRRQYGSFMTSYSIKSVARL